jgi:phage repressor protein C with HTH and peptisase S24 domain
MATAEERPIDRLLRWMKAAGMNQVELADKLGVQPGHVTNWKKRGLPHEKHAAAARLFRRSIDELVGVVPERPESDKKKIVKFAQYSEYSLLHIPVRGTIHIGQDGYGKQQQHPVGTGDGYINMPSHDQGAYAIRIIGDTTQSRIRSGEYVVVEPAHPLVAGEEVLIITKEGQSMVRDFLYQRDGQIAVQNIRGERLTLLESDIETIHYVAAITKQAFYRDD